MHIYIYTHTNTYIYFPKSNGKRQLPLFAANGNGKRKFVFLGRQTINGKRNSLFQQTYPSHNVTKYMGHSLNKRTGSDRPPTQE